MSLHDFRTVVYYPARALLDHRNPYDWQSQGRRYPETPEGIPPYAPHALLLHVPFALLDFDRAAIAYWVFTMCASVALAFLAVDMSGRQWGMGAVLLLAAGLLMSRPGRMNYLNGNVTVHVVLGAYLALHWAERRPTLAAVGLVVALAKPTIGVPLALFLLARGDTRTVLLGGIASAVLSAAAAVPLVADAGGPWQFISSLRSAEAQFWAVPEADPLRADFRVDAIALATRLLNVRLPAGVEALLGATILGVGVLAVRRFLARGGARGAPLLLCVICLSDLIFAYQSTYGVLILTLPVVALWPARGAPQRFRGSADQRLGWLLFALLLVPFVNFGASIAVYQHLGEQGPLWRTLTCLNGADLLIAWGLVIWIISRAGRHPSRR